MNCIIVDDEPLAQRLLEGYIKNIPFLNLKGVYKNALDIIDVFQQDRIDLMLLDINMPKISGLDVLRSLQSPPIVIITTAYREHAVDAYELDVIDYLKKPFSFSRFLRAVNKAQDKMRLQNAENVVSVNKTDVGKSDFVFVKANKKTHKIALDDIVFVESMSDYVKIHLRNQAITIHTTLKSVEGWLPKNEFPRIHKSYIVSISKIELVEGNFVKINDFELPIGGSYRKSFTELINFYSRS